MTAHDLKSSPPPFRLSHAVHTKVVKGEDVMCVQPLGAEGADLGMFYLVCDGHLGVQAADFVAANLHPLLSCRIPLRLPDLSRPQELQSFSEQLRVAICEAFVDVENRWQALGHTAGTTVTMLVVTGGLLTVANVGDSSAVLDTGCSLLELTRSHRLQDSPEEKRRLEAAGCCLAQLDFHLRGAAQPGEVGVGPLRVWPGGLCVSRSIGDADAGPEVLPLPHIKQVLIPPHGCRVILASDGLWDVFSLSKAVKFARTRATPALAATDLVRTAAANLCGVLDDTSAIVVDVLPSLSSTGSNGGDNFGAVAMAVGGPANHLGGANKARRQGSGGLGSLLSCFRPEMEELDSRDVDGVGRLLPLADVDCLAAFPAAVKLLRVQPQAAAAAAVRRGSRSGNGGSSGALAAALRAAASEQQQRAGPASSTEPRATSRFGASTAVTAAARQAQDGTTSPPHPASPEFTLHSAHEYALRKAASSSNIAGVAGAVGPSTSAGAAGGPRGELAEVCEVEPGTDAPRMLLFGSAPPVGVGGGGGSGRHGGGVGGVSVSTLASAISEVEAELQQSLQQQQPLQLQQQGSMRTSRSGGGGSSIHGGSVHGATAPLAGAMTAAEAAPGWARPATTPR